jgi:hypothetical protein
MYCIIYYLTHHNRVQISLFDLKTNFILRKKITQWQKFTKNIA